MIRWLFRRLGWLELVNSRTGAPICPLAAPIKREGLYDGLHIQDKTDRPAQSRKLS